ncbi:MAG: hypothetical protein HY075_05355, partial [Deltaproteobacteria bacterium]|nr:hypothetical protein [Deltaproteobacteria bacterium]
MRTSSYLLIATLAATTLTLARAETVDTSCELFLTLRESVQTVKKAGDAKAVELRTKADLEFDSMFETHKTTVNEEATKQVNAAEDALKLLTAKRMAEKSEFQEGRSGQLAAAKKVSELTGATAELRSQMSWLARWFGFAITRTGRERLNAYKESKGELESWVEKNKALRAAVKAKLKDLKETRDEINKQEKSRADGLKLREGVQTEAKRRTELEQASLRELAAKSEADAKEEIRK